MHLQSSVDMDALDSENWYEDVENENAGLSQVDNPAQTRRNGGKSGKKSESFSYSGSYAEEEELQAIFERTFGPVKRDRGAFRKRPFMHLYRRHTIKSASRVKKNTCWLMVTISSFHGKN